MQKRVYFGQSLTDLLDKLGNPNKEYHKGDQLFLNYFELGLDVMIQTQDFTIKKIILHANNPEMPDFCFYDRCCFELKLKKTQENGQESEII